MINFNIPPVTGDEIKNLQEVLSGLKHCGDGLFTKKCSTYFETTLKVKKALLTTSCTHSLEIAALLAELKVDDEVILPSFTFVSTADAIVLRGAKAVFVDIDPITMNMNPDLVEEAITPRTRAIFVVHYAGISCDMNKLITIAKRYNLILVEDAAQALGASYDNIPLGTIGDIGCFSFHETKNISCGEGGLIVINRDQDYVERAEVIREKGTNRSKYFRGQIDKYTWEDLGSSYLPSEFNAAVLFAQISHFEKIQSARLKIWDRYYSELSYLQENGKIEMMRIPEYNEHNAHMFWIKLESLEQRTRLIKYAKDLNITLAFHYIPLHSSPAGKKYGRFSGEDRYTTRESEKLVRLPLYYSLTSEDQQKVIDAIGNFLRMN